MLRSNRFGCMSECVLLCLSCGVDCTEGVVGGLLYVVSLRKSHADQAREAHFQPWVESHMLARPTCVKTDTTQKSSLRVPLPVLHLSQLSTRLRQSTGSGTSLTSKLFGAVRCLECDL